MNSIYNIQNTELFERLTKYDCRVSYNGKTLHEGKYDEELAFSENIDPSRVVVEFALDDSIAIFTLTENNNIEKLMQLFEGRKFEEIKTDPKLYNSAMLLANKLPVFDITFEGSDASDIRKYGTNYKTILENYLIMVVEKEEEKKTTERGDIKFTIWAEPDRKVKWLEEDETFQKIEYKFEDKAKGIKIDFLLGKEKDEDNVYKWKLWVGKVGSTSYDDDPYCDLDATEFKYAIINALDKVEEMIADVRENPDNWVQFYIKL